MQPVLAIQNLSIDFKTETNTTAAVLNSSFVVHKGELVAIVGESGSGKSVTSLAVLQLLPKQATIGGRIIFHAADDTPAVDLLQLPARDNNNIRGNKIAMIFQEPMTSLNPVLTCGSQVMEAIQLHQKVSKAAAREKTIALFEKVQLPAPEEMLRRYPHQLSGGQKQRVMIAMAMSCNPALLIADEPTTALDVTVQKTILELIKALQVQNNMGVIFITHDLGVVADIADKVLVMYKGEIVEQGTAKDIMANPQHRYTKALIACRPAAHAKGQRLPVISDFMAGPKTGNDKNSAVPQKVEQHSIDTPPATVLSVEQLKVYFPLKRKLFGKATQYFKAVDDVSFTVNKGETIGLVGESGCGKTTLGRAILQLVPPTSGNIILNGHPLTQVSAKAMRNMRKDLQIVFQDPYGSLNPRLTIGNAIAEPLQVHGIMDNNKQRKEKVIALLEKVNLTADHFNRYPHQFSGGQRQRICIARALALDPAFLIFDESVSALDVSVQAQVLNLLNDLKKEFGFTSIFISHDLSVVHYISDRIMVMHQGKIVEQGEAGQVYYHPANAYTQKLVAAIPGKNLF